MIRKSSFFSGLFHTIYGEQITASARVTNSQVRLRWLDGIRGWCQWLRHDVKGLY